jgi:hypothetical protein
MADKYVIVVENKTSFCQPNQNALITDLLAYSDIPERIVGMRDAGKEDGLCTFIYR